MEPSLERSLNDLIQFYPNVMSVSIVPVGLTDHRKGLTPLKAVDTGYARKTIDHIAPFRNTIGSNMALHFATWGTSSTFWLAIPSRPVRITAAFPWWKMAWE